MDLSSGGAEPTQSSQNLLGRPGNGNDQQERPALLPGLTWLVLGLFPGFSGVGNNSSGVSSSSLMRSFPAHKSRGQEVPPEVQAGLVFFFPPPLSKGKMCLGRGCEWGGPGPRKDPAASRDWDLFGQLCSRDWDLFG